jgi:hypothetical protein
MSVAPSKSVSNAPMEAITTTGTFFDGISARPRPVTLRLTFRLDIVGEDVARDWSLLDLRAADAAAPLMRVNHAQGPESVEFADEAFAQALMARCPDLNRTEGGSGVTRLVLWSIAAGLSVLLTAIYGVPAASGLLAPLVPQAIEAQLGRSVDGQIVTLLDDPPLCNEAAGRAVLDRLTARLSEGMALPVAPQVSVRRHKIANALALPGGRVILLSDIIAKARNGDELGDHGGRHLVPAEPRARRPHRLDGAGDGRPSGDLGRLLARRGAGGGCLRGGGREAGRRRRRRAGRDSGAHHRRGRREAGWDLVPALPPLHGGTGCADPVAGGREADRIRHPVRGRVEEPSGPLPGAGQTGEGKAGEDEAERREVAHADREAVGRSPAKRLISRPRGVIASLGDACAQRDRSRKGSTLDFLGSAS